MNRFAIGGKAPNNPGRISSLRSTLIIAVAVALIATPSEPDAQRKSKPAKMKDRRFDHGAHETAVKAAGKKVECGGVCHQVTKDGKFKQTKRNEHKRCSQCHTIFRRCSAGNRKAGKVCIVCHQNFKQRCFEGPRPNFAALKPTYVASYSHKQHIQPGAASGRQCEKCHGEFGSGQPKKGPFGGGHAMCSGCHERGVEPLMDNCAKCHVAATGPTGQHPVAKPRPATPYATTGAFDHQRHARADRVGVKGRECLTCHGNINKAKDNYTIPMPTMEGCYKDCHNGRGAFSATGATCTRCHRGPGGRP